MVKRQLNMISRKSQIVSYHSIRCVFNSYSPTLTNSNAFAKRKFQTKFKDDELTLIKRVDKNWYEARVNNTTKGLVPVNYLNVSIEPITTHDNSNLETESLSPAPSVSSRPTSMTSHNSNEDVQARLSHNDEVFR